MAGSSIDPASGKSSARQQHPFDDRLWTWRASWNENVDGQCARGTGPGRVSGLERRAARRAGTNGDDDPRLGHRVVRAARGDLEIAGHRPRDEQQVRVPRGRHEVDAEPLEVMHGIRRGVDLPVAAVARARVEMTNVDGAPEDTACPRGELAPRIGRRRSWDEEL